VELADAGSALTERDIKDLRSLVLMHDAKNKSAYRTVELAILVSAHAPTPHYLVHEHMTSLLADYEDAKRSKHIIEAAAEFHLRFEGIHPFIDGNGRTGRLILNLELIKAGFLPVNIKFADRGKYFDCFDDYYSGNRTPNALTQLILACEEWEILEYTRKLSN
jgi:Fic family protein